MNYYQLLDVPETASQDEIKKAFRKLAAKHHPDKGGDTATFQNINQAYDTLSDPQKRAQYDAQRTKRFDSFSHDSFNDIHDIFNFAFSSNFDNRFGPGFANFTRHQKSHRNKDLTIRVAITFKQSFQGTQIEAKFKLPSGKDQIVVIDVPAGIQNGQTIRYTGLGSDSIADAPRGNLNVHILVQPDPNYERHGLDLHTKLEINVFEAILGCSKEIEFIDGTKIPVNIRPGVQQGSQFSSAGRGFKDINTGQTGNLIINLSISIPEITDQEIITKIKELHDKISNLP